MLGPSFSGVFKGWAFRGGVRGESIDYSSTLCRCTKMRFIPLICLPFGCGWKMALIGFLLSVSLNRMI